MENVCLSISYRKVANFTHCASGKAGDSIEQMCKVNMSHIVSNFFCLDSNSSNKFYAIFIFTSPFFPCNNITYKKINISISINLN